jgi:hypothetical protein
MLTKGIIKWGIRDAREIEQWNPRLRFLDQSYVGALCERIPSVPVRLLWRLVYGSDARRGGAVSGTGGRNAAMAVLASG